MKLKHATSEYDLHSHEISYGSGSGQQSVTGYKDTSDAASLWAVKGAKVTLHVHIINPTTQHSTNGAVSLIAAMVEGHS